MNEIADSDIKVIQYSFEISVGCLCLGLYSGFAFAFTFTFTFMHVSSIGSKVFKFFFL